MFTTFELNLIYIFNSDSRIGLISNLEDLLLCLTDTGTEMYTSIQLTLAKLNEITDEAFDAIDLNPDWQEIVELADALDALLGE